MKIGLIGLGDIAKKAYMPVITNNPDLELVLCTRNMEKLKALSKQYKIKNYVQTVEELIAIGIEAAFVHSATEVHYEIAEKLLNNGIHVYVDKPIAYTYDEAKRIVEIAEKNNRKLMVGFNRRFAPMYKNLKDQNEPNIILMEKNRTLTLDGARRFIFDDFIHVVDTLRFLIPGEIQNIDVDALIREEKLYGVTLKLSGKGYTAIGIMNRDSGITEEVVEFINTGNKWIVKDLINTTHYSNGEEKIIRFKDWDPILYRRGFYNIIDHFIDCIKNNKKSNPSAKDSLITHEICEKIVKQIENLI